MSCCSLPEDQQTCKLPSASSTTHSVPFMGLPLVWHRTALIPALPGCTGTIILHIPPRQLHFLTLTQFFLSLLCLICLRRLSLCCHHNFLRLPNPHRSFLFFFYRKASLVCKWLKYNIPPTFFCIFYYLVAMVLKTCGGWLAFCPSALTVQRLMYLCPVLVLLSTWLEGHMKCSQMEQSSSLPRSRHKTVVHALHQQWGERRKVGSWRTLWSQENRQNALHCRYIFLLSNMKIFFLWQVQMVLSLKTTPYLTALQGLPALLEK